jgi:hypothetical protein
MRSLWQDVRFGIRMLGRSRRLATIAILALALGMGANTAIFSVVNAVLVRPLPYPDPDRLVWFWEGVYDAQGKRHRNSRTHGRTQTPAEVALRLLILKHEPTKLIRWRLCWKRLQMASMVLIRERRRCLPAHRLSTDRQQS